VKFHCKIMCSSEHVNDCTVCCVCKHVKGKYPEWLKYPMVKKYPYFGDQSIGQRYSLHFVVIVCVV
jgi:hypothetical protein